jgi:MFS family permease
MTHRLRIAGTIALGLFVAAALLARTRSTFLIAGLTLLVFGVGDLPFAWLSDRYEAGRRPDDGPDDHIDSSEGSDL